MAEWDEGIFGWLTLMRNIMIQTQAWPGPGQWPLSWTLGQAYYHAVTVPAGVTMTAS